MQQVDFSLLEKKISGYLKTDQLHRIIYATDASVYRALPLGVVYPKDRKDVVEIVKFCRQHKLSIIPRAGGTSLAGQCVGNGLVVDVSRFMNKLISVDEKNKVAVVQPGIVRDELNHYLKEYNLMVGPNTSTANRATIGGMVGNNSCGSTSIVFGSTRDHVVELECVMSDSSIQRFSNHTVTDLSWATNERNILGDIYTQIDNIRSDEAMRQEITDHFPKSSIKRRNTGYAIDYFLHDEDNINVCDLLCGSEGTLAFTTEITINLVDVPPPHEVLVAIHFETVDESLKAVPAIMNYQPFACELMDKTILDCTREQRMYEQDRFFIEGDPLAIMLVSFVGETPREAHLKVDGLINDLKSQNRGYSYPVITENIKRIWNLRKAGLGLLANLPGDKKAVACIEDTAVAIEDLSAYIAEFTQIMNRFGQKAVYYAHAGDGELHLRPLLDLKKSEDRKLFHEISLETARLVKKYRGSLSGEHGDGRVRAPFIKEVYGEKIYQLFKEVKHTWDPENIFNPGKIVDAPAITEDLRYEDDHAEKSYETMFDFSSSDGILRAAEKCNGSGDCRKLPLSGGTMCPSYMATRNEKDTTRARANTLREILTRPKEKNAWDSAELKESLDLCLSCKGCTSECPSNVDMSTLKAEFQYQYQKVNGVPFRSKVFSSFDKLSQWGSKVSGLTNFALNGPLMSGISKRVLGVHPDRSLPKIHSNTLRKRYEKLKLNNPELPKKIVHLFCDEFTNYNDPETGERAILLLQRLGYAVEILNHAESGRAAFSKGVLDHAKKCANTNVQIFSEIITEHNVLIGIEPSAILSFRDEYPKIVNENLKEKAQVLSERSLTIEEFLYDEIQQGSITSDHFSSESMVVKLHGHCHQKALTDIKEVAWVISIIENAQVDIIPSGCCGMAGSFGYEKEHYDVSMQIGELVLFPAVREAKASTIIAASGTSCRHQISDGTERKAKHVVEVLFDALKPS